MEHFKKFLTEIGVDSGTIEKLSKEELPEDFSIEESVSSFVKKRKDLVLNDGDLRRQLKKEVNDELYPSIMKKVLKSTKSIFSLSEDEVKSLTSEENPFPEIKDLLSLGREKIAKSGAQNIDEANAKFFELQKSFEDFKTQADTQIKEAQLRAENDVKLFKVSRTFSKTLQRDKKFILPLDTVEKILEPMIVKKYGWAENEDGTFTPLNADGTKVTDGNNFLTLDDLVTREAKALNLWQESNGGQPPINGTPPGGGGNPVPPSSGTESAAVKALKERMGG